MRRTLLTTMTALVMLAGVAAARHLRLTDSFPKSDQTVTESPDEVRLWFSEDVSLAVSRVALEGPDGEVKLSGATATDDRKSFKALVSDELATGPYTVNWRTAGNDGHVIRGEFSFTVAPAARH